MTAVVSNNAVINSGHGNAIQFYSTTTSNSTSTNTVSSTPYALSIGGRNITVSDVTLDISNDIEISPGQELDVILPDGALIKVKKDGSYKIEDKDAKVTYRANNIREFNRYINTSDLLEEFIRDCGKFGARQNQVLHVPIELFINWLIIKAAEEDGDKPPKDVKLLEDSARLLPSSHHRCLWCGKFITNDRFELGVNFCDEIHAYLYMRKHSIG